MSREQSNVSDLLSKVSKMPVLRGSITKVVNFVRYAMTLPDFVAALVSYKPWVWLSNLRETNSKPSCTVFVCSDLRDCPRDKEEHVVENGRNSDHRLYSPHSIESCSVPFGIGFA